MVPMKFKRRVLPVAAEPVEIVHGGLLQVDTQTGAAVFDGVRQKVSCGCWMFYLPAMQAKLFYADDGKTDCIHASRPSDAVLNRSGVPVGRYLTDDWRRALSTPVTRRLAELWLVSVRLWKAGLGPQPLGVCFVDELVRDGRGWGPTCGLLSQNVLNMPRKLNGRIEDVRRAGVIPDRIQSCVRQQVHGYVIDLCSVIGCMPADADASVVRLETHFRGKPSTELLQTVLEESLRLS
jgi:hypothetical protein